MSTSTTLDSSPIGAAAISEPPRATFGRLTPVFLVDRIEPCLDFWVDRLGFEARLKVDGEEGLDFVLLARDEVQLSYKTRASVARLSPELLGAEDHLPWVILYLPVSDLGALVPHLDGIEVIVPLRETDFGVRELYLREPSGRVVALIEQG